MIKFRWYYDKDKEEIFLNKMSTKGWAMKSFFLGFYRFEKCEINQYTYRIDLKSDKSTREFNEFIEFVRDAGGELVQTWGVWAYFRKEGKFELYSDKESQINEYKRIRKFFTAFGIFESCVAVQNLSISLIRKEMKIGIILLIIIGLTFFFEAIKFEIKIRKLKNSSSV